LGDGHPGRFALHDPTGISEVVLSVSEPALFILSLLDGRHSLSDVRIKYRVRYGQEVLPETVAGMVKGLESAHLLEGESFDAFVRRMQADFQAAPVRPCVYGRHLGDRDQAAEFMGELLPPGNGETNGDGRVVGLIAPHLDFPRGAPCYAKSYGRLHGRERPHRCVILGTNHFGQSSSLVATTKTFETPLGETEVDVPFLEAVERRCGHDLRTGEMDHGREHSVEIQVMCLQHLFGAREIRIVPFLCPDPCGPDGTRPHGGRGVDLRDFADALRAVIMEDGGDTLVVAGADLSHVGRQFGDAFALDAPFLRFLEERDRRSLAFLEASEPEAFVQSLAQDGNVTRVCSAGCIYVAAVVLRDAKPTLRGYHQAFTEEQQICVSCTAMTYAK